MIPSLHQLEKLLEQIIRIVRTGRSFGMILNAECRQGAVFETFDRVVVQIDVRDVDVVQVQAFRIDGETVILSRDLHLLPLHIKDGMVSAMMAEFQLECPAAKRQTHDLMSQANSEDWFLTKESTDIVDGIFERLRIAGTIGEKHAVGLQRQYFLGRSGRRNDCHLRTATREIPQNMRFDSEVISHDVKGARLEIRERG